MFSNKVQECVALRDEVEVVIIAAGKANVNLSRATDPRMLPVDPRLAFHMGATYLLGGNAARTEFQSPEMTGHLGSVIYHLFKGSTLAKSPHISSKDGAGYRIHYDTLDSFVQNWDDACMGVSAAMIVTNSDLINAVCGVGNNAKAEKRTWCEFQVRNGTFATMDEAEAGYDSYNDIFDDHKRKGTDPGAGAGAHHKGKKDKGKGPGPSKGKGKGKEEDYGEEY